MKRTNSQIFDTFKSAPEFRTIEFANANNADKLEALLASGAKFEKSSYKIARTIDRTKYESDTDFIKAVANRAPEKTASIFIDGKVNQTAVVNYYEIRKVEELTTSQKIDILSRTAKIDGGKIAVENFGGENFLQWCKWLRELTAEEFEKISK